MTPLRRTPSVKNRILEVKAEFSKRLVYAGEGFLCRLRILDRSINVNEHHLLARPFEEGTNQRNVQFVTTDNGIKGQADILLKIHFSLAKQADRVSFEVNRIEINVFSFDPKTNVTLTERRFVRESNAEDFQ